MKVRDVMTRPVVTCQAFTNLSAVADIMWRRDCGIVPVVDEGGRAIGVVTDRDVCIAVGTRPRRSYEIMAEDVMSKRLHTCRADDEIEVALDAMGAGKVRRLPVVDAAGKVEGILSISDLILRAATDKTPGISAAAVMRALGAISAREHRIQEARAAARRQ